MDHIWDLLAREETKTLLISILGLVVAAILRLKAVQKYKLERALQCLEAAVRVTYEEYVRAAKAASEDGKLTTDQRQEALRQALDRAGDYARVEGVDLLKYYAIEYLPVIVEKIIGERKAASVPFVSALPLPELPPVSSSAFSETTLKSTPAALR